MMSYPLSQIGQPSFECHSTFTASAGPHHQSPYQTLTEP
ncbi:hypothetical protein FM101_10310 [Arthrobacter rhombi]|uniref:Uncharacterized protein n=1 Tax=Arthrobacter rhombi TaxID=71253 RepID=A0A1R4GGK1_9MICC|nr:hypothetical protein FM101_10310 [Arthrobacter rhombi]